MASNIMECLVEMAWDDIRTESASAWLEDDPDLRNVILTRIRKLEEARVKELEETLVSERQSRKKEKEAAWLAKKREISERSMARKKEAANDIEVEDRKFVLR